MSRDTGNYGKSAVRANATVTVRLDDIAFGVEDADAREYAADSWDMANRDTDIGISWTVDSDTEDPDGDVSVSAELLGTLLRKARAYDACVCTCSATDGRI